MRMRENIVQNNLTNDQRSVLLRLSCDKNIVIKLADKGGALVIMDSNKYNEACLQQLTDNEYYEEIEHDPNTEYRQVIDSTVDKMSAAESITDFESTKMKEGTRTPRFYGLPKIHKQYSYNGCTVRISEFVDKYLTPITQQSLSHAKDTAAFFSKLRNFTISPNTTANHFLVTGMSHLCTPILTTKKEPRHKILSLLCNFLRRLIYLVLKCNTQRFGSRFFHQIKGTAMGTQMPVNSFANIFMSKFEEEMLDEFQFTPCPLDSFY